MNNCAANNQPAGCSDVLVRVEDVSKKFCRSLKKSLWYGVKDIARELTPWIYPEWKRSRESKAGSGIGLPQSLDQGREYNMPPLRPEEFWAVRNISFELRRGECLGLIGRNGAGKTTLLKMLHGLIKPDVGRIEMYGRVGALIELGTGFNPILTGRENIYTKGAVLGLTKKEIDKKFSSIVEFAELEDFIDMPVQNYSSGMKVRLGFAVSAQMEPDILIIDEVLAVGDAGFRAKCYNTIYEICKNACVIFVSHSMPQVDRLCSSTILLEQGKEILPSRKTGLAIEKYYEIPSGGKSAVKCSPGVEVTNIKVNNEGGASWQVRHNDQLTVSFDMRIPSKFQEIELTLGFLQPSMETIGYTNTKVQGIHIHNNGHWNIYQIIVSHLLLGSGKKLLSLMIRDRASNQILYWAHSFGELQITSQQFIPAPVYLPARFVVLPHDNSRHCNLVP